MLKISCSNLERYFICPSALNHEQEYVQKERTKYAQNGVDKHLELQASIEGTDVEKSEAALSLEAEFKKIDPEFSFANCVCEERMSWSGPGSSRPIQRPNDLLGGTDVRHIFVPPYELVGKPDLIYVSTANKTIYIPDYKFGYVYVEENNNLQLLGYAYLCQKFYGLEDFEIKVGIFQNGELRLVSVSNSEIEDFLNKLEDMIFQSRFESYQPAEKACKYCHYREKCPTLLKKVEETVKEIKGACLPELSEAAMFDFRKSVIQSKKLIEFVLQDTEEYFKKALKDGGIFDFCSLKSNGSMHCWDDTLNEAEISGKLASLSAREPSDFYEKKLKSPAQVKKLLGIVPEDLIVRREKAKSLKIEEVTEEVLDLS